MKFLSIILCIMCISCSVVTTGEMVEFDKEQFDRERTAWEALNIDAYQYIQNFSYLMPGIPLKITVAGDKKVSSEPINADDEQFLQGENSKYYCFANTIDTIFDRIEADIARDTARLQNNEDDLSGISVEITYNAQYHYPTLIDYKMNYSSTTLIGTSNRYTLTVSGFSKTVSSFEDLPD